MKHAMLDDKKNGAIYSSAAGLTSPVRPVNKVFSKIAKVISRQVGRAWIFVVAVLSIVVWAAVGPLFNYSDTWQLVINTGTTTRHVFDGFSYSERAESGCCGHSGQARRAHPSQQGAEFFCWD